MKNNPTTVTCLFIDIGDVLLTNGWDHHSRRRAAKYFQLDWAEIQERHALNFETHEADKLSLKDYLDRVVFYEKRPFSRQEFQRFMFAQSKPFPKMLTLIRQLKVQYRLKIIVVSNEARAINAYRIRHFKLAELVDAFVSSCFIGLRKPDVEIYRLALDIAQVPTRQIVYVDNTALFVQIAEGLGIRSVLHADYEATRTKLATFGLSVAQIPA